MSATKSCPFCAEEIRAEALKCKHCNSMLDGSAPLTRNVAPQPQPIRIEVKSQHGTVMRTVRNITAVLTLMITASIVGTCFVCADAVHEVDHRDDPSSAPSSAMPDSIIGVTAGELSAAYERNEAAADQKYRGRLLSVTGTVQRVSKTFDDHPVVELWTDNEFMPVRCSFSRDASDPAGLAPGQRVILRGRGDRYVIGANLRACELDSGAGATCQVPNPTEVNHAVFGVCADQSSCTGAFYRGFCVGASNIVCCVSDDQLTPPPAAVAPAASAPIQTKTVQKKSARPTPPAPPTPPVHDVDIPDCADVMLDSTPECRKKFCAAHADVAGCQLE